MLYVYWTHATIELEESRRVNEMIDKAYSISQVWFREGIPKYWNAQDVIDIGLSNDYRFNRTKMNSLNDSVFLGYERVKSKIGIKNYEFSFKVYNSTQHEIFSFGPSPSNPENLVKVKRFGILDDGSLVTVEVMVWE
jgi:hypothetical protein